MNRTNFKAESIEEKAIRSIQEEKKIDEGFRTLTVCSDTMIKCGKYPPFLERKTRNERENSIVIITPK